MATYSHYLATTATAVGEFAIHLTNSPPASISTGAEAIRNSLELRYSPIMWAYLSPQDSAPPAIREKIESVTILYANIPAKALGELKPHLTFDELSATYFTEGLASIVLLNIALDRASKIREIAGNCPFEFWPVIEGRVVASKIVTGYAPVSDSTVTLRLPSTAEVELQVYVEQISASLVSLWASYGIYFPQERNTLCQVSSQADSLLKLYSDLKSFSGKSQNALADQKKANAIISALVEISAALSYAVTQGTSGSLPVLSNRSPFPHHSLFGIGGAVRALTKYTRYLESAFITRSAGKVISDQYSILKHSVPSNIARYNSGPEFKFSVSPGNTKERFDNGGEFKQEDHIPLIAHFSLRHGFMESKFSVTAASEALTSETLPHWTLMTLSHEVMHSRVRTIFQALFGKSWDDTDEDLISKRHFDDFLKWVESRDPLFESSVGVGIRNAILNFCYAIEKYHNPIAAEKDQPGYVVSMDKLSECYVRHKQLATEIVVHFHDYYFVYACQPKMYVMSLWASWIKVAAPYARPLEYLVRSMATIACGTGLPSSDAFNHAKDILLEGLDALEAAGVASPLFHELRRSLSNDQEHVARAYFYPCYYLVDIVRLFFASKTIAARIDRIESDPFSEGSVSAHDYSANIYVIGEEEKSSPIRYSLATLFMTLLNRQPVDDPQWLTARNYMVISSQE